MGFRSSHHFVFGSFLVLETLLFLKIVGYLLFLKKDKKKKKSDLPFTCD